MDMLHSKVCMLQRDLAVPGSYLQCEYSCLFRQMTANTRNQIHYCAPPSTY